MTVDWTKWADASPEDRAAMLARYREIVKQESDRARETNYRAMEAAMAAVGRRVA